MTSSVSNPVCVAYNIYALLVAPCLAIIFLIVSAGPPARGSAGPARMQVVPTTMALDLIVRCNSVYLPIVARVRS